jgi:hypothetical protein
MTVEMILLRPIRSLVLKLSGAPCRPGALSAPRWSGLSCRKVTIRYTEAKLRVMCPAARHAPITIAHQGQSPAMSHDIFLETQAFRALSGTAADFTGATPRPATR